MNNATLRALLAPGLSALLLVVLGIGLLVYTDGMRKDSIASLERTRSERLAMQTRLLRVTDEEQLVRKRLVGYQELLQRGVIGEERRLDWVDELKRVRDDLRLYDLKYSVEARRPVDYPGVRSTADVEILASRMRLEAQLLHEGDLLALLREIRDRLSPYVVVRTCRMDRTTAGANADPRTPIGPQLKAECQLDLITIRDRGGARS